MLITVKVHFSQTDKARYYYSGTQDARGWEIPLLH